MKHRRGCGRRRMRRGRGKIGDWFRNAAGKVKGFLQKSKILSKVAPIIGTAVGQPSIGAAIGNYADKAGYGMRRHRRHGKGPYRFDLPPFSAGRGYRRIRHRGRGTPGMGMTDPTTYPIATSLAIPRF